MGDLMRLSLSKFYRGYRELDSYSDEECERMVVQAHARRGDAMWVIPGACVLAMLVLVAPLVFVVARLAARTVRSMLGTGGRVDPVAEVVGTTAVAIVLVASAVVWVGARRVLLMRSVLNHLEKAQCPYCRFSLRGLRAELGAVVCPECGQRIVLADEGIFKEDLLPRQERAFRTWRGRAGEEAEAPAIPLEPETPAGLKRPIRTFGGRKKSDGDVF